MKKSKILMIVMIFVLLCSCFAGCGDDKSNGSEDLKHEDKKTILTSLM